MHRSSANLLLCGGVCDAKFTVGTLSKGKLLKSADGSVCALPRPPMRRFQLAFAGPKSLSTDSRSPSTTFPPKSPAQSPRKAELPAWQNMLGSLFASSSAVVITNPFDVVKVRMQLQGEVALGGVITKVYRGSLHCIRTIARAEGLKGFHRGIQMAVCREGLMNMIRLGLFSPILKLLHKSDEPAPTWKRLVAGASSGTLGAVICNPVEIIKIRMQAQSAVAATATRSSNSVATAFHSVVDGQGLRGLYVGTRVNILRDATSTAVNMTVYTLLREQLLARGVEEGAGLDLFCAAVATFCSTVASNPIDVVRTRLFNQPFGAAGEGLLYDGPLDVVRKTVFHEGPLAFYKGLAPAYLARGPQVILSFLFLEQLKRFAADPNSSSPRHPHRHHPHSDLAAASPSDSASDRASSPSGAGPVLETLGSPSPSSSASLSSSSGGSAAGVSSAGPVRFEPGAPAPAVAVAPAPALMPTGGMAF